VAKVKVLIAATFQMVKQQIHAFHVSKSGCGTV